MKDFHELDEELMPAEAHGEYDSLRDWLGWSYSTQKPYELFGVKFTPIGQCSGLHIYYCDKAPRIRGNFDACYVIISGHGGDMRLATKPCFSRGRVFNLSGLDSIRRFLHLIRFASFEEYPRTIIDVEEVLEKALKKLNIQPSTTRLSQSYANRI